MLTWRVLADEQGRTPPAYQPEAPGAGQAVEPTAPGTDDGDFGDSLLREVEEKPVGTLSFPAVVVDRIELQLLATSPVVAGVRPRKVHVHPGQDNPIRASVSNLTDREVGIDLRLTILTGMREQQDRSSAHLTVPPGGTAEHEFNWQAGNREFGHEARLEVLRDGRVVDVRSAYFSVSSPVWKTSIQGNGFIFWHRREDEFDDHVRENRRNYINVEEAFSWQPSSWTDLTPEGEIWWTGQNDYLNTLSGLKKWLRLSRREGIKMITYMWPTASGPQGLEFARRFPRLITHQKIGLGCPGHDVEDPEELIQVEGPGRLSWRRYVKSRTRADGTRQVVVHLISPPPTDRIIPPEPHAMPAWQRNVKVAVRSDAAPEARLLQAEPRTSSVQLEPHRRGEFWEITVPLHRYWSVLVFDY